MLARNRACMLLVLLSLSEARATISASLTHWYAFEPGSFLDDSSGNGMTLTAAGNPNSTTSDCAVGNGCATLSNNGLTGASSSAQHFTIPAIDFAAYTDGVSVSMWFKLNSWSQWIRMWDFSNGGSPLGNFFCTSSAVGFVNIHTPQNKSKDCEVFPNILGTVWRHMVVTVEPLGNAKVFMDGALVKEAILAMPIATTQNYIGKSSTPLDPMLSGTVDDFRIYSGIVSEAEVVELFREGQALDVTHHYGFDTQAMVDDSGGSGNMLTAENNPTYETSDCRIGEGCAFLSNEGLNSQTTNAFFALPPLDWATYSNLGISISMWFKISTQQPDWTRFFDCGNTGAGDNFALQSTAGAIAAEVFDQGTSSGEEWAISPFPASTLSVVSFLPSKFSCSQPAGMVADCQTCSGDCMSPDQAVDQNTTLNWKPGDEIDYNLVIDTSATTPYPSKWEIQDTGGSPTINFKIGTDMLLHFNARVSQGQVVLNSFVSGTWGTEVRIPFESPGNVGRTWEVEIDADGFHILDTSTSVMTLFTHATPYFLDQIVVENDLSTPMQELATTPVASLPKEVSVIGFTASGQTDHDPSEVVVYTSAVASGSWTMAESFALTQGSTTRQALTLATPMTAQYWKFEFVAGAAAVWVSGIDVEFSDGQVGIGLSVVSFSPSKFSCSQPAGMVADCQTCSGDCMSPDQVLNSSTILNWAPNGVAEYHLVVDAGVTSSTVMTWVIEDTGSSATINWKQSSRDWPLHFSARVNEQAVVLNTMISFGWQGEVRLPYLDAGTVGRTWEVTVHDDGFHILDTSTGVMTLYEHRAPWSDDFFVDNAGGAPMRNFTSVASIPKEVIEVGFTASGQTDHDPSGVVVYTSAVASGSWTMAESFALTQGSTTRQALTLATPVAAQYWKFEFVAGAALPWVPEVDLKFTEQEGKPWQGDVLNTWQHLALAITPSGVQGGSGNGASALRMFLNGKFYAPTADKHFPSTAAPAQNCFIGQSLLGQHPALYGLVDDFRLYSGVITQPEVDELVAGQRYTTNYTDGVGRWVQSSTCDAGTVPSPLFPVFEYPAVGATPSPMAPLPYRSMDGVCSSSSDCIQCLQTKEGGEECVPVEGDRCATMSSVLLSGAPIDPCAPCDVCSPGSVSTPSGNCTVCPANTYASGGVECAACHANSTAPEQSTNVSNCECIAGYEPSAAACAPCPEGTFKNETGNVGCLSCPALLWSPEGASNCTLQLADPPQACHNTSIRLSGECPAQDVTVFGCARNQSHFEADVLTVDGGTELQLVSASCDDFYGWMCQSLGAVASSSKDCVGYCQIMGGVQGACSPATDSCMLQPNYVFSLFPPGTELCAEAVRYTLHASCEAASTQALASSIDELLAGFVDDSAACDQGDTERATLQVSGEALPGIAAELEIDEICIDGARCEFACLLRGIDVERTHEDISVSFPYIGDCSCPTTVSGSVIYGFLPASASSPTPLAANVSGIHMNQALSAVVYPLPSSNALVAEVRMGSHVCLFAFQVETGTFLGLPTALDQATSTPKAMVSWQGFESTLSAPIFLDAFPHLGGQADPEIPTECPTDDTSCVFQCFSAGFSVETFAGVSLLLSEYNEDHCNCSAVFSSPPDRPPSLRCTREGPILQCSQVDVFYSELGPITGDNASGTLPVQVTPASGDEVLFSLGPGVCVYRFKVFGGFLVGAGRESASLPPTVSVSLRPLSEPSPSCPADDCAFACVSGGSGGLAQAEGGRVPSLVGDTEMAECECNAVEGTLSSDGSSFTAGEWVLTADAALNVITFSYGTEGCSGWFVVSGGSFLGIPRPELPDGQEALDGGDDAEGDSTGIAAVTVGEAETAAAALTVGVATAVGVAVGAAVASGVASAAGGATGGAASGAAGGGAVNMIYQAQFLAVAGRIGGPDGQPESSQALSEGMGWSNYHIFTVRGEGEDEDADIQEETRELESDTELACRLASENPRELGATVIMSAASLVGSFFGRAGVCKLLQWFRVRQGLDPGDPAFAFPSWEVQVLLTQFQGLGESAGDAIASGCFPYEFGGGAVLVTLLVTLTYLAMLCLYGIRHGHAVWKHISLKEGIQNMKDTVAEGKGQNIFLRMVKVRESFDVLVFRGEWDQEDHPEKNDVVHTSFVDRYGALFDAHHSRAWWYGFWAMFRGLVIGVILSAVLDSRSNASAILSVGTLDFVIHTVFNPDSDWLEVLKNIYRNIMNVAVISSVIARINGVIPDNVYSNIFYLMGIITMVPMIVTALFSPILNLIASVKAMLGCFSGIKPDVTPGGLAGVAAVGAVAGAGFDRDAIMEEMAAAREEGKAQRDEQYKAASVQALPRGAPPASGPQRSAIGTNPLQPQFQVPGPGQQQQTPRTVTLEGGHVATMVFSSRQHPGAAAMPGARPYGSRA